MIITLALRALQIIFAVIVLGLSVSLAKGQDRGKAPSQTDFAAFCGGCGLVFAAIGVVACFIEVLQGIIMTVLDGIATLFTLAGGIALAVALKVHSCSNDKFLITNSIINAGAFFFRDEDGKSVLHEETRSHLQGRCHEAQATTAFLYFMFALFAGTCVLGLLGKGGRNGSIV